jgi:hypothetical protein
MSIDRSERAQEPRRYLPFEKSFDEGNGTWNVVGKDRKGRDFGVGSGKTLEIALKRLREWVIEVVWVAAGDGMDVLGDLHEGTGGMQDAVVFRAEELPKKGAAERQKRLGMGMSRRVE